MKFPHRRSGFILVSVLVVIMLASMVAVSLMFRLRAAEASSAAGAAAEQAWLAAMSGIAHAIHIASQPHSDLGSWTDNADAFEHRLLFNDGSDQWFFSIFTWVNPEDPEIHFGLADEANRFFLAQTNPNPAPESAADPLLPPGPSSPTNSSPAIYDLNIDHQGNPRVNLNDPEADLAAAGLPESAVDFIEALRQSDQTIAHPVDLLEASFTLQREDGTETEITSGIGQNELPMLLNHFTATNAVRLPALVNIHAAPAPVLESIPGVDSVLANSILSQRAHLSPEQMRSPAWLYQENLVSADQFKQIAPFITTRTFQFRFQVAGYAIPSGRYRVLEAVIDLAASPPSIPFIQDRTHLGFPLPIDHRGENSASARNPVPFNPEPRFPNG